MLPFMSYIEKKDKHAQFKIHENACTMRLWPVLYLLLIPIIIPVLYLQGVTEWPDKWNDF